METAAQLHRRAIPAIKAILAVFVMFNLFSCASSGQNIIKKDTYTIINMVLSGIKAANQNAKVYIDTNTNNALFIEELNTALLVNKENKEFHFLNTFLSEDELLTIFNSNEINFMTKQLNASFVLDLGKINVKNVFKYREPDKKKDEKGTVIAKEEMMTDHTKIFYRFSKPVFTLNNQYSTILVTKRYSGHWIEIYKKQEKEWVPYKKIMLGIY